MLRKNKYKDMDRYWKTHNAQCKRYYSKSVCGRSEWSVEQDKLVIQHDITDTELSKLIHHSVKAIQIRRSRLKKRECDGSMAVSKTVRWGSSPHLPV